MQRNEFLSRRSLSSRLMGAGLSAEIVALANVRRQQFSSGMKIPSAIDESDERSSALQGRLEEILVFELRKDGGRDFLRLSVRGLYKHVLAVITSPVYMPEEEGDKDKKEVSEENHDRADDTEKQEGEDDKQVTFSNTVKHPVEDIPMPDPQEAEPTEKEQDEVTYRERLGGYLHPRDMRRLVTPFSALNEPDVIVRRHVILLNFDPLRCIILRDRLLLIVPDGADSLLISLEQRVRGGVSAIESSIFGGSVDENTSDPSNPVNTTEKDNTKAKTSLFDRLTKKGNDVGVDEMASSSHSRKSDRDQKFSFVPKIVKKSITASLHARKDSELSEDNPDDLGDRDEWEEIKGREWINLPFELQCVDACLHIVCDLLLQDTNEIQDATLLYIQRILSEGGGLNDDPLLAIRHMKDAIREMDSRVKSFVQSMNRILDNDEYMALMNLSRLLTNPERFIQPVPPEVLEEESDEPELILEAHLQNGLTLQNALGLIQGQIDTASELVDRKQDALRNKILAAQMILTVVSLCVAIASLVGSFMGMNVTNHIEDDPNAFKLIVAGTVAGSFLLCLAIIFALYWSGVVPKYGMTM